MMPFALDDRYAEFLSRDSMWFDEQYMGKLQRRFASLKLALQYAIRGRLGPSIRIVETGCVRQELDYSAGYSTVIFGEFLARYGGRLDTIDITAQFLELCQRLTRQYQQFISYHLGDSVAYLRERALGYPLEKIDLLYLDSLDYPLTNQNIEKGIESCQRHCWEEVKAALPCLHVRSLVLIDDNDLPGGGKARLAKQYLAQQGWICVFEDYQTLWTPADNL